MIARAGLWVAVTLAACTAVLVARANEYAGGAAIARHAENPAGTRPGLLTPVTGPPRTGDTSRAGERPALSTLLARVAANEGAFSSPRDLDLIWQTVEGWAPSTAERRARLCLHSARVAGVRPCAAGNCLWSPHVRADGSLPAEVAAAVGMDPQWWDARRAPAMRALFARARVLVDGGPYTRPCASTPSTWGRLRDHSYATARGLVRLHCTGTTNDGYASAGGRP